MAEWLKVILLGVVEGITEFLPISSTGHLIVVADLVTLRDSLAGTFEIFIQIGAVLAVIFYYRADLWLQARNLLRFNLSDEADNTSRQAWQLWLGVLIAFTPAAIIGLLLVDWIDEVLFSPLVVAIALIVGGIMFIVLEQRLPNSEPQSIDETPLTYKQAFIVGLWQTLALIPRMSRSGMSIIGGMLAGCDRSRATQFSFYLAIPTLGAATIYTLISDLALLNQSDLWLLLLGAVVSGIVAWFAIDWLLRYVATNSFIPFGYYRIALGVLIIIVLQIT